MRICSRCKKKKSQTQFNFKIKSKGILQYNCKECSRIYIRTHYEKNREYYLLKAKRRNAFVRKQIKAYVWDYFNNNPCIDCGENDPIVLEFDHRSDKIAAISEMYRNFTLKQVIKEISKCEVRCANCHRRKTAIERGWYKKLKAPVA